MTQPLVTIAIPTYNRSVMLRETVESALAQTWPAVEVLVMDNASSDETPRMLQGMTNARLRVIRHESNVPMFENWNRCVHGAAGEYFLLLADDDLLQPGAIATLVQPYLRDGDAIGLSYGRAELFETGKPAFATSMAMPEREESAATCEGFFRHTRQVYAACALLRTADLRTIGGYDGGRYRLAADAGAWMACALRHRSVAGTNDVVGRYRVHAASGTMTGTIRNWLDGHDELAALVADHLTASGEARRASAVHREARLFNLKTAIFLLTSDKHVNQQRSFGSAVRDLHALCPLELRPRWLATYLGGWLRLALPASVKAPIRRMLASSRGPA